MSEHDYQRGLRGGDCQNYEGEAYRDWYAGMLEYERGQKEIENQDERNYQSTLSREELIKRTTENYTKSAREYERVKEDQAGHWKEEKENAYKKAEIEYSLIFMELFFAFVFLIAGGIIQWFLGLFKVEIPTFAIWIIPIILVIYGIWTAINASNKALEEAEKKYGKRD